MHLLRRRKRRLPTVSTSPIRPVMTAEVQAGWGPEPQMGTHKQEEMVHGSTIILLEDCYGKALA